MDLGVHLELDSRNCNDRLIVAASGGIIGYGWGGNSVLGEMGLIAGMRLGHFSFQAGPAIYFGGSLYSPMIGAHGSMAFTALY